MDKNVPELKRVQNGRTMGIAVAIFFFFFFVISGTQAGNTAVAGGTTITIYPIADTYIYAGSPDTNFVSDATLQVSRDEFLQEDISLMTFSLDGLPSNAIILSAELRLYLTASNITSHVLTVNRIIQSWTPSTVTWNNQPGLNCCWGNTNVGTATNQTYVWDVTSLVTAWHDGTSNFGLALRNNTDVNYFKHFSSQQGAVDPELVVNYILPLTPTPTTAPLGSIGGTIWHDDDQNGVIALSEDRLENVRVDLLQSGIVQDTVFTNSSGQYTFSDVPAGTYNVDVEQFIGPNFEVVTQDPRPVSLSAGQNLSSINFGYDNPETDLRVDALEVTQGIQNQDNTVRLVANKRTYVRVHVSSTSGDQYTTAVLHANNGSSAVTLIPITPFITVRPAPDYAIASHSFLFELPAGFRSGNITLEAELNAILPGLHTRHSPLETTYGNNTRSTSVSFETVPELWVDVLRVRYSEGGSTYQASNFHIDKFISWLERAYPVSSVRHTVNTYTWWPGGRPNCSDLNFIVGWDIFWGNLPPRLGRHVYAMVDDGGGFMRGCSMVPAWNGSGPTGIGDWGWDTDGSYGDWYGAHEFAHTLGRSHVSYCGADGSNVYPSYPYRYGNISSFFRLPDDRFRGTHHGFDILTREVYGPLWKDVMTYCDNQWISEYTYHGLMNIIQSITLTVPDQQPQSGLADRLFVNGTIDPAAMQAELGNLFVIPNIEEVIAPVPGDYDIVLQGAGGTELARYPFTPAESHSGPPEPGTTEPEIEVLTIVELVPYVAGTEKVVIEGPDGTEWGSVSAGTAVPDINITAPTGGTQNGATVTASWTASDADNDPLSFVVEYSPDNGSSWEIASLNTSETSIEIESENLPAGNQARFRVWVSDGIHTNSATSNAFIIPNHEPTAAITAPDNGTTFVISQTVTLVGAAFDADTGSMTADQLTWKSSLDGTIGMGENLSVSDLSVGTHMITFEAYDGVTAVIDQIQITIVSTFEELPTVDNLLVGPNALLFDNLVGILDTTLAIENENGLNAITWNATASESWVQLSANSGMTPDDVTVAIDTSIMDVGTYTATVTVTSPDVPGQTITVPVHVTIGENILYLPFVTSRN